MIGRSSLAELKHLTSGTVEACYPTWWWCWSDGTAPTGGMPSNMVMVLEWWNSPHWLYDDNDDIFTTATDVTKVWSDLKFSLFSDINTFNRLWIKLKRIHLNSYSICINNSLYMIVYSLAITSYMIYTVFSNTMDLDRLHYWNDPCFRFTPCPSQTSEGMEVKKKEWRKSTFHEG